MVRLPIKDRLPVYDWHLPLAHLASIRAEIEAAARYLAREGAENALMIDIRPLEHRYQAGERSPELYEAMLGVRFRSIEKTLL